MKISKKQKRTKEERPEVPGEWLYLAPEGVTVRQIAETVLKKYGIELWEEAGVLEIELGEGSSIDMEHTAIHPKDTFTRSFVEENGCAEVYLVTFAPENYDGAKEVMRQILAGCGGLFCGDTENFTPIIRGTEL